MPDRCFTKSPDIGKTQRPAQPPRNQSTACRNGFVPIRILEALRWLQKRPEEVQSSEAETEDKKDPNCDGYNADERKGHTRQTSAEDEEAFAPSGRRVQSKLGVRMPAVAELLFWPMQMVALCRGGTRSPDASKS